jgi:predicted dehydrogenase
MEKRNRYAIIGAGGRSMTYLDALTGVHHEQAQVVALCDPSPARMAWHNQRLANEFNAPPLATYAPDAFNQMLREQKPDGVIVCTPDYLHHEYVIRGLEAGCDAICEKPMTIDAGKMRGVFDAIHRTGRKLRVTFNARYLPEGMAVKKLVLDGAIGVPTSVDLFWTLDTSHGADYFRRWHREKKNSGGLLVHKASHHFDLVNWWIDSWPQRVFAFGELKFYGRKNAESRGEKYDYDRYTGAAEAKNDPFAIALDSKEELRGLYLGAERDSGYVRDRNVFGDGIDIEDTVALTARYRSGVLLSYSLVCFSPWEGFRVAITGTKGRLELHVKQQAHILHVPPGEEAAAGEARGAFRRLCVYPMFGVPYDVPVANLEGTHNGSDALLFQDLFSPTPGPDPLGRRATHLEGAAASLIGMSANESIATGQPVDCDTLLPLPHHRQLHRA